MPGITVLEEERGRVHLRMEIRRMGSDFAVLLFGGVPHVGAVALGVPHITVDGHRSASVSVLTAPQHRDDEVARVVVRHMTASLQERVSVVCGVHLDHITSEEIALVLELANKLAHRAVAD